MAHLETWWKCPGCHRCFDTQREAAKCAVSHVRSEQWAVSDRHPGKAVACSYRGVAFALREADLSDLIDERRRELAAEGDRHNGHSNNIRRGSEAKMELNDAILHARQVAEGCASDNRDCAYQHDQLANWLDELNAYRALGSIDHLRELVQAEKDGRLAELPFVAMVEQSLQDGKMTPQRDQRFNGRYAVVYSDKKKWAIPLIDICGRPYDREQAEERLAELTRKKAEAALC